MGLGKWSPKGGPEQTDLAPSGLTGGPSQTGPVQLVPKGGAKGGKAKVRGAGIAQRGVRPAKMR